MHTAASLPFTSKLLLLGGGGPKRPGAPRRAQDIALAAIAEVSSYLDSEEDPSNLIARLCTTVADLTGARRAAFWGLGPHGSLTLHGSPHGFPSDSAIYAIRVKLAASGNGALERTVFTNGVDLRRGTSPALDAVWRRAGLQDIESSIAASWTAGVRRMGVVAAYDSARGFTAHDLWLLRLVGSIGGLVWQY